MFNGQSYPHLWQHCSYIDVTTLMECVLICGEGRLSDIHLKKNNTNKMLFTSSHVEGPSPIDLLRPTGIPFDWFSYNKRKGSRQSLKEEVGACWCHQDSLQCAPQISLPSLPSTRLMCQLTGTGGGFRSYCFACCCLFVTKTLAKGQYCIIFVWGINTNALKDTSRTFCR